MDAEGRIIPIVEDDQGEGWKDLVEADRQATAKQLNELSKKHNSSTSWEVMANQLEAINRRLDRLEMWLRQTIGSHVLIKGRWVKID